MVFIREDKIFIRVQFSKEERDNGDRDYHGQLCLLEFRQNLSSSSLLDLLKPGHVLSFPQSSLIFFLLIILYDLAALKVTKTIANTLKFQTIDLALTS
jgi:hypothetical protein